MKKRNQLNLKPISLNKTDNNRYFTFTTTKNKNPSLKITSNQFSKSIQPQQIDIYFDEEKRKNHLKNIIDLYFQHPSRGDQQTSSRGFSQRNISSSNRSSMTSKSINEKNNMNSFPKGFYRQINEQVQLGKTFLSNKLLPPIVESAEDREIIKPIDIALQTLLIEDNQQKQWIHQQQLSKSSIKKKPRLVHQNEVFKLFYIQQKKSITSMIKQYKQQSRQIFLLQQKIFIALNNLGIQSIWTPNAILTCTSRFYFSLKSQIYDITKESIKSETIYKIIPKPFYYELLKNQNQGLINIIKKICEQLHKIKDKFINNKISLANCYYYDQNVLIGQWGHSATKQTVQIGKENIVSKTNPILKGSTQWFVTPQYLPPEFLDMISGEKQYDIWQYSSAIDIWSLGCATLQLITLIPLWIPIRCQLSYNLKIFRRGLFHSKARDIREISYKQYKFCQNIKSHLQKLGQFDKKIQHKLIETVIKMLDPQPSKRPTPQQVIKMLD